MSPQPVSLHFFLLSRIPFSPSNQFGWPQRREDTKENSWTGNVLKTVPKVPLSYLYWMTITHRSQEDFSRRIIGAAIEVHRHLGPGLLESNYEECLCLEFADLGLKYRQQVAIPVSYKGHTLKNCYRPDLIVENSVIVEVKCVEKLMPVHTAQVMTYMKHTAIHLGLLFNFNTAVLTDGIKRIVL